MHCALLLWARPIQALAQISQFAKWTIAIYFVQPKINSFVLVDLVKAIEVVFQNHQKMEMVQG
jgi:hypothetical protein